MSSIEGTAGSGLGQTMMGGGSETWWSERVGVFREAVPPQIWTRTSSPAGRSYNGKLKSSSSGTGTSGARVEATVGAAVQGGQGQRGAEHGGSPSRIRHRVRFGDVSMSGK